MSKWGEGSPNEATLGGRSHMLIPHLATWNLFPTKWTVPSRVSDFDLDLDRPKA